MKYLILTLLTISLLNCKENRSIENRPKYIDQFYSALDVIVKSNFPHVTMIVNETMPVYRNMYGNYTQPNVTKDIPPPPPPPGIIYYDNNTFDYLTFSNQLDSTEAKFMYMSIDSTRILNIDSSRLKIRVIQQSKILEIFSRKTEYYSERWDDFRKIYGQGCLIRISTPIFNSKLTKMILSVNKNCGPPDGEEYRFILEKKNGEWKIIEDDELWQSR